MSMLSTARKALPGVVTCSLALLLLFLFPLTSSAHALIAQDPNTSACSSPISDALGDGAIMGYSCFHVAYPSFLNQEAPMVNLSFFSSNPGQWTQCKIEMQVDEVNAGNGGAVDYTYQTYNCLDNAQHSQREVAYGDFWLNAPFIPHPQHSYQVVAMVSYQYNGTSHQRMIESQVLSPS